VMRRDGAIIFRDLVGKLDALTVECDKCGRRGRYNLHRLIERYDIDAKLFEREPEADCPRKRSMQRWRGTNTTRAAHGARTCRRWCNQCPAIAPIVSSPRDQARLHRPAVIFM
jgi:hypothetical protein